MFTVSGTWEGMMMRRFMGKEVEDVKSLDPGMKELYMCCGRSDPVATNINTPLSITQY